MNDTQGKHCAADDSGDIFRSLAPNTARAYRGHVRRILAFSGSDTIDDRTLRDYCIALDSQGKSISTITQAIAAAVFWAMADNRPTPKGNMTLQALRRISREHTARGHAQAAALTDSDFKRIAYAAIRRRKLGRAYESFATLPGRALEDIAIVGFLYHAGMRRSEIAALRWPDIQPCSRGDKPGVLIDVTQIKTGRKGKRFVGGLYARAIEALRPDDSSGRVFSISGRTISNRFQAAAKAAGFDDPRISAHSGRVSLACELIRKGASTADIALAGGWQSDSMVIRYGAGVSAAQGAVVRLLDS